MSAAAKNMAYLRSITEEIDAVPAYILQEVSAEFFVSIVMLTKIDTGQAALNWQFEPHYGSGVTKQAQQIYWGYGDVSPSHPLAGIKSDQGSRGVKADASAIVDYQFSHAHHQMSNAANEVQGVLIYNPITPGFPGFAPGDDADYESSALDFATASAEVELSAAEIAALPRVRRRTRFI